MTPVVKERSLLPPSCCEALTLTIDVKLAFKITSSCFIRQYNLRMSVSNECDAAQDEPGFDGAAGQGGARMARDWNDDEVWRLARRVGGEKFKVSTAARSRLRRIAKRTLEVVVKNRSYPSWASPFEASPRLHLAEHEACDDDTIGRADY